MTDHTDILSRLASTSVVIGNLPELPGYNGSVLTIDDEEAARCVADIDAGRAEITRLRAEAEALRKALQQLIEYADTSDDCQYGTLSTSLVKDIANAAIDATKGTT